MSRDYVVIWRNELNSDKVFDEYCQMKNAVLVDESGEDIEAGGDATGVRFYTVPEQNKIVIWITEDDADDFKDVAWGNRTIDWRFNTQDGTPIDVHFADEED